MSDNPNTKSYEPTFGARTYLRRSEIQAHAATHKPQYVKHTAGILKRDNGKFQVRSRGKHVKTCNTMAEAEACVQKVAEEYADQELLDTAIAMDTPSDLVPGVTQVQVVEAHELPCGVPKGDVLYSLSSKSVPPPATEPPPTSTQPLSGTQVRGLNMWKTLLTALLPRARTLASASTTSTAPPALPMPPPARPAQSTGISDQVSSGHSALPMPVAQGSGDDDRLRWCSTWGTNPNSGQASLPTPDGVEGADVVTCHILMRAWLALCEHDVNLQPSRGALDSLARALGYRPHGDQTYALLAGVLACYVWPARFTTWQQATKKFDSSVANGRSSGAKYINSIRDLLTQLGGVEGIREALAPLIPSSDLARRLAAQQQR